ncbi:hypothetical protein AB0M46_04510 [Dactylosporangium sp. NPDC051485]|uniref:hypothetical protein n=1 Tax=Dactylosporangium sp. NPDC051485 TaxID=3154846 RepID=UPI00344497D1
MHIRRWFVLLAAGLGLVLAAAGVTWWIASPAGERLDTPGGLYEDPVWAADGYVYFLRQSQYSSGDSNEVWRTRAGARAEKVTLAGPRCAGEGLTALHARDDGRLGLLRGCTDRAGLIAVDPATGSSEEVMDLTGVPAGQLGLVYQVAWPPAASAPIVASSRYQCAGLGELTASGVRVEAPVALDGRSWALAGSYTRRARDCTDLGAAGFPVPYAGGLLFMAAPTTLGRPAGDRNQEAWNVYQRGGADGAVVTRGRGYRRPWDMARTPSCAVVVSANRDGEDGLYLDQLRGRPPKRLAAADFRDVTVAPDGSAAVAVEHRDHLDDLRVIRLPKASATGC